MAEADREVGFPVMEKACSTCIYRKENRHSIKDLEDQVRDSYGGFKQYRQCHHNRRGQHGCCRGFWNRHKDKFQLGQLAQRLGLVRFIKGNEG